MTTRHISFILLLSILMAGCVQLPNNNQPRQITQSTTINTSTPEKLAISPTDRKWSTPTSPAVFIQWAKESKRWLKGIPCSAPCWNGITPGKTSVREAIRLLKNNSLVDSGTVQIIRKLCGSKDGSEISNSRKLIWKWSVSPEYYFEDGSIYYSEQELRETKTCPVDINIIENILPDSSTNNGIINKIDLDFPGPNGKNENYLLLPTLDEVMKAYGQPSHILAVKRPDYSWYDLSIIYEKQRFVLRKTERNSIDLNSDTYFVKLIFSANPLQEGLAGFETGMLNIWQGLKNFDFYCKLENGQSCQ